MALNERRGEVGLEIDGELRPLVFDWDALARLEKELGPDFDTKIAQAGYDLNLKVLATALAVGLKRSWPKVTPDLVMRAGPPLVKVIEVLGQALNLAFYGSTEAPTAPVNPPVSPPTNRRSRRASSSRKGKKLPTAPA